MKHTVRLAAAATAVVLFAAACGDEPEEDSTAGGDADFTACMVSDEGGVNDKSFNETSFKGLTDAQDEGITGEPRFAESNAESDYAPNVQAMVDADCGIIVTVGFALASATSEAAEANPEETFAIVDNQFFDDAGNIVEIENVKPLLFNTHEAAFLAGYVAAGVSTTGKVGTWGGAPFPTVTIFMDGFSDGVAHYNEVKGTNVEVLGWDKAAQSGQFVGDFSNTGLAKQISESLIQQGADILLPVAGPLGEQAALAAQEAGNVNIIWVDSDGFESAPAYGPLMVTSVLKGMDVAVTNAIRETADGNFSNEAFVGTLENDGVGIAPYHDWDSKVPQELKDEVDQLKQDIIDGTLTVESDAAF